jgi:hypothetical protein
MCLLWAAITSKLMILGFAFSASYYGGPTIDLAPIPLRLQQWQVIYDMGKWVAPPAAALSGVLWGVAAWISCAHPKDLGAVDEWVLYSSAGVLSSAFLLWTTAVMLPVNNDLMRKAKIGKELDNGKEIKDFEMESVRALSTWNKMNWVRAVLPMTGAWVGLYASLR